MNENELTITRLAISHINGLWGAECDMLFRKGMTTEEAVSKMSAKGLAEFRSDCHWLEETTASHGFCFLGDESYPATALYAPDPPFRIAWLGNPPPRTGQGIAIVGTRKASYEGLNTAFRLGLECAKNGFDVYSGYADGVDWAAHRGAAAAGGRTWAVMASGLANSYAARRPALEKDIIECGGGLLSQFTSREEPFRWNFRPRNCLMASLAQITCVVEAPKNSGSLITAHSAAELGRDVFVYCGLLGHPFNTGSEFLVAEGAKTFLDISDVVKGTVASERFRRNQLRCSEIAENRAKDGSSMVRFNDFWYKI